METAQIIREMQLVKDKRTKNAIKLKENFFELLKVAEESLELSNLDEYGLLNISYSSENCNSNEGDERVRLKWKREEGLFLQHQMCVYNCGTLMWKKTINGISKYNEIEEQDLEKAITTTKAFEQIGNLIKTIAIIKEKSERYNLEQEEKIQKANEIIG